MSSLADTWVTARKLVRAGLCPNGTRMMREFITREFPGASDVSVRADWLAERGHERWARRVAALDRRDRTRSKRAVLLEDRV